MDETGGNRTLMPLLDREPLARIMT